MTFRSTQPALPMSRTWMARSPLHEVRFIFSSTRVGVLPHLQIIHLIQMTFPMTHSTLPTSRTRISMKNYYMILRPYPSLIIHPQARLQQIPTSQNGLIKLRWGKWPSLCHLKRCHHQWLTSSHLVVQVRQYLTSLRAHPPMRHAMPCSRTRCGPDSARNLNRV